MKRRRNRTRRGACNSEAATERELRRMITILRRGLGVDNSFEAAVASLRRQLIARGGGGRLRDLVCHLDEDGRGALLAANWSSDEPVIAGFTLSAVTGEDEFDSDGYVKRAMAEAADN